MTKLSLIAAIFIYGWSVTYPAVLADVQAMWIDKDMAAGHCRKDMGFAMGWSLLPPAWVVAPFLTGFYEHGFKWNCS
jgi:hypothetical protein